MGKMIAVMVLVVAFLSPSIGQAKTLEMASGATFGGLAGSVYVNGLAATSATVASATVVAADAVAYSVAALATAFAAASTPVMIGIVVGGAVGILLAN